MALATSKWKDKVIAEYRSGVRINELVRRFPVSRRTIHRWIEESKVVPLKKEEAIA